MFPFLPAQVTQRLVRRSLRTVKQRQLRRSPAAPEPVVDPDLAGQPVGTAGGGQIVAAQVDPTYRTVLFLTGDQRRYTVTVESLREAAVGPGFDLCAIALADHGQTVHFGGASLPAAVVVTLGPGEFC